MKTRWAGVLLVFTPLQAIAVGGYLEGNLGYMFTSDVKMKGSAFNPTTGTISNIGLDYDDALGYGLEVGLRNFERYDVLRIGLAWDRFDADLDRITLTASGGTSLAAGNYSISSSELKSLGFDFDNSVNVYTVNLYYDFPSESKFTFSLGAGVGLGDVENARDEEFAWKFSVGGRYQLTERTYIGLRYDHIGIDSLEDELGLSYDDVAANRVAATLTYAF